MNCKIYTSRIVVLTIQSIVRIMYIIRIVFLLILQGFTDIMLDIRTY